MENFGGSKGREEPDPQRDPDQDRTGLSNDDDWVDPLLEDLRKRGHDGTCPYPCPVCMGIGLLKQMRPDVADHLVAAGRELLLAARAFMDQVTEEHRRGEDPGVEKIPID